MFHILIHNFIDCFFFISNQELRLYKDGPSVFFHVTRGGSESTRELIVG